MEEQGAPIYFGEWLKRRRRELDLTQAELADAAGCTVFALRKIEAGERRPSKQLAHLLASPLGVAPGDEATFVRVARGELPVFRLARGSAAPATPTAPSARPPVARLPRFATPFVGRETELAALGRLLADPLCRLVTIIGPGGMGKTRLAVEAAARYSHLFPDGVCYVPAVATGTAGRLIPAVAGALGLSLQGQAEPLVQLGGYLRERQVLLLVDNAEHLLDNGELFAAMLADAPGIKFLVTSRERLNLQSEWVYIIQGLPVPPEGGPPLSESFASVELFAQSARRARPDYAPGEAELPAVRRICRLVEGMPLGIELAAAWVAMLPVSEIAAEIEHSLDFLATTMRDVPDRQRSLRAAFDYSWNLLSTEEQAALSRLSLFRGGFNRDAAAHIAGAAPPVLLALVSKSLLRPREGERYELHEVIRQYAFARFVADPACSRARERHSRYYLDLLRDRAGDLRSARQAEAIRHLTAEIDNIRAAWTWAVERRQFSAIGPALRGYGWLCDIAGWLAEGIAELEQVVAALREESESAEARAVLGTALAQQGLLNFRMGRFGRASALLEESLDVLRPLGDPALLTDALVISGIILHLKGELTASLERIREGLEAARASEDRWNIAYSIYNLGYLNALSGDDAGGYARMREGLALWRAIGEPRSVALGLNFISPTAIRLGRLAEAEAYLRESLELCSEVGDRWGTATAYRFLGLAALAAGRADEAKQQLQRSVTLFSEFVIGWDIVRSLVYLGEATAAAGDATEARATLLDALYRAQEAGATPLALDAIVRLGELDLASGDAVAARVKAEHVLAHPSATYDTRQRAEGLRAATAAGSYTI